MMRIQPLHKIYLTIVVLSLLLSVGVGKYFHHKITPYSLKSFYNKQFTFHSFQRYLFHDLNNDGYSERLVIGNNSEREAFYVTIYLDTSGVLDQFNFTKPLVKYHLGFWDITGDGWKEVFIFSHDNEALYLSVLNVAKLQFLFKEVFVLAASPRRARKNWDVGPIFQQLVDLDGDGKKELLFSVHTGYAHVPRCVAIFDLDKQQVTRRFDHHLGYANISVVDLDKDGRLEIALSNVATNNLPKNVFLSDAYSWIVLLDHDLTLLQDPVRVGEAFSRVTAYPLSVDSQNYFLIWNVGRKAHSLWLIDSTGKSVLKKEVSTLLKSVFVNRIVNPPQIIASTNDGRIQEFNHQLQKKNEYQTPGKRAVSILKAEDIFNNGNGVFFAQAKDELEILDGKFNLLARYPLSKGFQPLEVSIDDPRGRESIRMKVVYADKAFILELAPNPIFKYLYLFYPLFFIVLVGGFTGLHKAVNRLQQYVSYFLFSLHRSDNAIILLDHRGRIITVNQKINLFLKLKRPLKPKQHFKEGLQQWNDITRAIQNCIDTARQVQTNFTFEGAQHSFIGEITVTPFFSYFQFVNAYLVEIKDSTRQVLYERQQNWQRNIRRMIHDIKTPLAGVQIKLQMIYMKLKDQYPNIDREIYDELEAAHSEVLRIRNISKDFLKFSDLDRLQVQAVQLPQFIEKCVSPFLIYTNERIKIYFSIAPEVPPEVYWDARQIELLLHILIENSLDALHGEGEINIQVVNDEENPRWVEIRITDNGEGIPEAHRDKIFEPHFSTKKEGSGLGLVFAKRIVLLHGGNIRFESNQHSGTVFVIRLPQKAHKTSEE